MTTTRDVDVRVYRRAADGVLEEMDGETCIAPGEVPHVMGRLLHVAVGEPWNTHVIVIQPTKEETTNDTR